MNKNHEKKYIINRLTANFSCLTESLSPSIPQHDIQKLKPFFILSFKMFNIEKKNV